MIALLGVLLLALVSPFEGRVTHVSHGNYLYLENGSGAVKVLSGQREPGLAPGDLAVASGTVSTHGLSEWLSDAVYERLEEGHLSDVPVTEVSAARLKELVTGEDGPIVAMNHRRVRLTGRILRVIHQHWHHVNLDLDVDGTSVRVWVPESQWPEALAAEGELNPVVSLTGILAFVREETFPVGGVSRPQTIATLEMCPEAPFAILPDAAYEARRFRRMLERAMRWLLGGLVLVIALLVVRIVRDARTKDRYRAVLAERKRMAADLHDSLEQNLAAAKMLLRGALALDPDLPAPVAEAVRNAAEILAHAKGEVRETIFNMHNDSLYRRSPEEVLRECARKLARSGVSVRSRFRGLPDVLPSTQFSDLLFLVSEAFTNALKHGEAKRFVLMTDPIVGGFRLRLANDGIPFDVTVALGPETGHFGLTGMRERARRSGFAIAWGRERVWNVFSVEVRT